MRRLVRTASCSATIPERVAVTLRTGRFGPYLQLGDATEDEKPKRASIPKGIDAADDRPREGAAAALAAARGGQHPETGKTITAGLGRYGPFVLHEGTYANLESIEDVFTIGLNRAVTLLAEKKAGAKAAARGEAGRAGQGPGRASRRRQDRGAVRAATAPM